MYYTYVYLDPRKSGEYKYAEISFTYEPIYIGKGRDNRLTRHLYENSKSSNIHLKRILRLLKFEGLQPIYMKLSTHEIEEESLLQEIKWIKMIGRQNLKTGPLVNFTNGGEGISGYKHTTEAKQKIINALKQRLPQSIEERKSKSLKLMGHFVDADTKRKISASLLGKKQKTETIQKRVIKLIGKKRTTETKKKMSLTALNIPNWKSDLFHYMLISPNNDKYDCYRNFGSIIKQHNLVYHSIMQTVKTNQPVKRGKCKGWRCVKIS